MRLPKTCEQDFFHLVDSFLADGSAAYKVDSTLDNMWMLRDEYKAVFHAVRELRLTDDTTLNQYIHNGYRALIMPIRATKYCNELLQQICFALRS